VTAAAPGAGGPGARPRGAARREALLETALEIIADVGPDAVTHRRVAEGAGLPLASTTYWFSSKEELLVAALELAADRDTERMRLRLDEALMGAALDEPGWIDAAVAIVVGPPDEEPQAGRNSLLAGYALLLEAARRPALQAVARRWNDAYLVTLERLLTRAGARQPREDAVLMLSAADGLFMGELASGESGEVGVRLRRLAEVLVRS
jgi:TetR/AcrR family transcriptional regulator, regulator of biofilm formation and stress response